MMSPHNEAVASLSLNGPLKLPEGSATLNFDLAKIGKGEM
jgi:hypothetical protein